MVPVDFAKRMKKWCKEGFKELGDSGGMGIGRTTHSVLHHPQFLADPHEVGKVTFTWDRTRTVLNQAGLDCLQFVWKNSELIQDVFTWNHWQPVRYGSKWIQFAGPANRPNWQF